MSGHNSHKIAFAHDLRGVDPRVVGEGVAIQGV